MKKKIVLGALIVVGIMCAGLVLYALLKLSIAYEGVAPIMSAAFLVIVYAHTLVTKFKREQEKREIMRDDVLRLERSLIELTRMIEIERLAGRQAANNIAGLYQRLEELRIDTHERGL